MFAILLSDKMQPFYNTLCSYPTIVFSVLVVVVLFYWCVAVLGLVDISFLDVDIGQNAVDSAVDGGPQSGNMLAGLLLRFDLNKVPLTVVLSFVALYGWVLSFFSMFYLMPFLPHWMLQYLAGTAVLLAALYISLWLTAWSIRPLRPFFSSLSSDSHRAYIGKTARVRTSRVDASFGEAVLDEGGLSLTFQVRHFEDQSFKYDDTVTLVAFDREGHFYHIVLNADA